MLVDILRYEAMSEKELYSALTINSKVEFDNAISIKEAGIRTAELQIAFNNLYLMYSVFRRNHSENGKLPMVKGQLKAILDEFGPSLDDPVNGVLERLRIVIL